MYGSSDRILACCALWLEEDQSFSHASAAGRPHMPASTLALELDRSESTVDEMVRRGVLPRPLRLSNGCVRWSWASVEAALASLAPTGEHKAPEDPLIVGARRAAQIAKVQREARAKNQKPK